MFCFPFFNNIIKASEDVKEKPTVEDLPGLNDIIFASMKKDCVELGCQFDSVLETNTSLLGLKYFYFCIIKLNLNLVSEKKFDQRFRQKINKITLSSAVRNSLNGLSKEIPSNGTMDSALNITLESVKEDIG